MSGGSMNYLYGKIENDATFRENTPERRAFARHLKLVAKALHDIEWVDSCDYGPGDETEAILACIGPGEVIRAALDDAVEARDSLQAIISKYHELA